MYGASDIKAHLQGHEIKKKVRGSHNGVEVLTPTSRFQRSLDNRNCVEPSSSAGETDIGVIVHERDDLWADVRLRLPQIDAL